MRESRNASCCFFGLYMLQKSSNPAQTEITQKGGAKPKQPAGVERDEFTLLPFDSPDTSTMELIKELNDSLVPSVFLEEKGTTPDREPATSPSPAGHPPLIKAPLSSPSPPTFHRWLYVRPSPTKHISGYIVCVHMCTCACTCSMYTCLQQSPQWSLGRHSVFPDPRASAEQFPPLCRT